MKKKWRNACGILGGLVIVCGLLAWRYWMVTYIFLGLLTALCFVFSRWMKLCAQELEPDIRIHDAVKKLFQIYSVLNEMGTICGALLAIYTVVRVAGAIDPLLWYFQQI